MPFQNFSIKNIFSFQFLPFFPFLFLFLNGLATAAAAEPAQNVVALSQLLVVAKNLINATAEQKNNNNNYRNNKNIKRNRKSVREGRREQPQQQIS